MSPFPDAPSLRERGTVVVLDLVESVRLIEADEAGTVGRWQALVATVTGSLLPGSGGRLVKSLGDGMMLAFPDPRPAVVAAFAIHRECMRLNDGVPPERRMWLRIGVHSGEHYADALDVYGHHVNLAARLATLAGPGETVVSADVRDRLTATLDAEIEDLGDCWLKHVSHPVRAFRAGPAGPMSVLEAVDPSQGLRPTLAVIPFAQRIVAPEQAALGEIIADQVITAMSRTAELDVISRLTTTALRGRTASAPDLAMLLGAHYVLSGTYVSDADRVSIAAELCETSGSRVVWSGTLHARTVSLVWGSDTAIERLVADIAAAVMARELQRSQLQSMPTLESFTLLISAIALMHRLSAAEFERARRMLDTVIERAPRRAEPQAWLAKWHVLRVHQGWSPDPKDDAAQALACTRRALQADSQCSMALAIEGLVQTSLLGRLDAAQTSYEHALAVNPNDSLAWLLYGTLHAFRGEGAPAVKATRRALRLSPLDPLKYYYDSLAATAALAAQHFPRAIALAERSLRANRTHTSTWRALSIAQGLSGLEEDARRSMDALRRLDPGLTVGTWLQRSPSRDYPIGGVWAGAMRRAGLPE